MQIIRWITVGSVTAGLFLCVQAGRAQGVMAKAPFSRPNPVSMHLKDLGGNSLALSTALAGTVGWAVYRGGARHAVLWPKGDANGMVVDLQDAGWVSSEAHAINAAGVIVGSAVVNNGEASVTEAIVWLPELGGYQATSLKSIAGAASYGAAWSVNNSGDTIEIAGESDTATENVRHATLWVKGPANDDFNVTDVDAASPVSSHAYGINNFGVLVGTKQVGGTCADGSPAVKAAAWLPGGTYSRVDLGSSPGLAGCSQANAIDWRGDVVGWAEFGAHREAVEWKAATQEPIGGPFSMKRLGTLTGDTDSVAYGLDNFGEIVGTSTNPAGHASRGFYYDGTLHDVDDRARGWDVTDARAVAGDVTDNGPLREIAGARRENTSSVAFLYTESVTLPRFHFIVYKSISTTSLTSPVLPPAYATLTVTTTAQSSTDTITFGSSDPNHAETVPAGATISGTTTTGGPYQVWACNPNGPPTLSVIIDTLDNNTGNDFANTLVVSQSGTCAPKPRLRSGHRRLRVWRWPTRKR